MKKKLLCVSLTILFSLSLCLFYSSETEQRKLCSNNVEALTDDDDESWVGPSWLKTYSYASWSCLEGYIRNNNLPDGGWCDYVTVSGDDTGTCMVPTVWGCWD